MEHYVFSYQFSNERRHLIWVSDDEDSKNDRFITDRRGMVPAFTSIKSLEAYAAANDLLLLASSDTALNDFDVIVEWLSANSELPSCDDLLNAWNAFSDIDSSTKNSSSFAKLNFTNKRIYDKIFWGNNLPAMTPQGEHYTPSWADEELMTTKDIFTSGIDLFISSTYIYE